MILVPSAVCDFSEIFCKECLAFFFFLGGEVSSHIWLCGNYAEKAYLAECRRKILPINRSFTDVKMGVGSTVVIVDVKRREIASEYFYGIGGRGT